MLLFTDPHYIGLVDAREFRSPTALETHRKNLQLGLRLGQAALIQFETNGCVQKAVWILIHNKLSTTKGGSDPTTKNPFWKFVVPMISYFACLPASIAHTFCGDGLDTLPHATYADPSLCYDGPHDAKRGSGVPAAARGLVPLGDTRNAQELAVFCQMPKERLQVACGLAHQEGQCRTIRTQEGNFSTHRRSCSDFFWLVHECAG